MNGATFLGIALACGDPDNTLIIEKGSVLGSDFYSSLRVDSLEGFEIIESLSKEMFEMIQKHKQMMHKDLIVTSEIMPVLGQFVEKNHLNILFDCMIINQKEVDNSFITETICRDQVNSYESEFYVETTNKFGNEEELSCNVIVKSSSNVLNHNLGKSYPLSENVYSVEMPVKTYQMHINREIVLSKFKKETRNNDVLLMIAETVCLRGDYKEIREGNRIIACSSKTLNMFDAMDRGVALWRNLQ